MSEKLLPKVFISYSHTSQKHVDVVIGLAESLTEDGVIVIMDKTHLKEGDDIQAFMERMITDSSISHVLVVSDKGYCEKANNRLGGVGTEAQIISPELYSTTEQRKFLPIVLPDEDGTVYLPVFLRNRLYINLSNGQHYLQEYQKIIDIIFGRTSSDTTKDNQDESFIDRYAKKYAVLRMAFSELVEGEGVSYATINALVASSIPQRILEKWWREFAEVIEGKKRCSVAIAAIHLLDKRGVGRVALEYCLADEHLDLWQRELCAEYFKVLTLSPSILWAHEQLVSVIKSDDAYYSFLSKHYDTIIEKDMDKMSSYLLYPDRGPHKSNMYSIFLLCSKLHDSGAFVERWCAWILEGKFDDVIDNHNESAQSLYELLSRAIENDINALDRVIDCTLQRIFIFLKSRDKQDVQIGIHHLRCMLETRFMGASQALQVLEGVYVQSSSDLIIERQQFKRMHKLLKILASINESPNPEEMECDFNRELNVLKIEMSIQ